MLKIKKNRSFYIWLLFFVSIFIGVLVNIFFLIPHEKVKLYPGLRLMNKNEKPEEYINEQAWVCGKIDKKDKGRYECMRSVSNMLSTQIPFKTIVRALDKSPNDCHEVMHNVVNLEYRKGVKLPEIWQQCTTACFGACYHGGFEGLLSTSEIAGKNEVEASNALKGICDSIKNKYSSIYYQCFHGMGHAFMLYFEGDLPKSLRNCDTTAIGKWKNNCYGGVFMENLPNSTTYSHSSKRFIKDNDPMYPCNILDNKYKATCYSFQASYFFHISKRNLPKVVGLCGKVPNEYRKWCFSQLGLMHINHKSSDQSNARYICSFVSSGLMRAGCYEGVIMGYNDRFPENFSEMKRKGIFEFCESLDLSYKPSCYSKIGSLLETIMPDKKERYKECENIKESQYRVHCQNGNKNFFTQL